MTIHYLRTILLTAASIVALGLAGCNTIAGAGEDIEAGGEAIEDTAEDTKRSVY